MLGLTLKSKCRSNVLDPHRIWDLSVLVFTMSMALWWSFPNPNTSDLKIWLFTHFLVASINRDPWVTPGLVTSIMIIATPEHLKQCVLVAVVIYAALATTTMENPPFARMASMILQLVTSSLWLPLLLSLVHYLRPAYSSADHLRKAVSITEHHLKPRDDRLHATLCDYADTVLSRGSIRGMRNYLTTTRELLVNEDPDSKLIGIIRKFEAETVKDQIWTTLSNAATTLAVIMAIPNVASSHSGVSRLSDLGETSRTPTRNTSDDPGNGHSAQPEPPGLETHLLPVLPQARWEVTQVTNSEMRGPEGEDYHPVMEENINQTKVLLEWAYEYFRDQTGNHEQSSFGLAQNSALGVLNEVKACKLRSGYRVIRVALFSNLFKNCHQRLYQSQDHMAVSAFTAVLSKFVGLSMIACSINEVVGCYINPDAPYAIRAPSVGKKIKEDASALEHATGDSPILGVVLYKFVAKYLTKLADNLTNSHVIDPHKDVDVLFQHLCGFIASQYGAEHEYCLSEASKLMERTSSRLHTLVREASAGVTLGPSVSMVIATCN